METKVSTIRAYGKGCVGCKRFESDIMITAMPEGKETLFYDLFLTQEQAQQLHTELGERLAQNKDEPT